MKLQLGNITAIHGDCMDYMKDIPDKYFDLAIVDPPYGININFNMGIRKGQQKKHARKDWDDSIPPEEYFKELYRVSNNQIIWGGNYFNLPCTKSWIFWDKDTPKGVSFADGELAWTSFDKTLVKILIPYSGFRGSDDIRIHPTQKPIDLYKWCLNKYANTGDKILDTHGGSFSHAIACHDLGFDLTIIEKDKNYFDEAIKRLKWHQRQQTLQFT